MTGTIYPEYPAEHDNLWVSYQHIIIVEMSATFFRIFPLIYRVTYSPIMGYTPPSEDRRTSGGTSKRWRIGEERKCKCAKCANVWFYDI